MPVRLKSDTLRHLRLQQRVCYVGSRKSVIIVKKKKKMMWIVWKTVGMFFFCKKKNLPLKSHSWSYILLFFYLHRSKKHRAGKKIICPKKHILGLILMFILSTEAKNIGIKVWHLFISQKAFFLRFLVRNWCFGEPNTWSAADYEKNGKS